MSAVKGVAAKAARDLREFLAGHAPTDSLYEIARSLEAASAQPQMKHWCVYISLSNCEILHLKAVNENEARNLAYQWLRGEDPEGVEHSAEEVDRDIARIEEVPF